MRFATAPENRGVRKLRKRTKASKNADNIGGRETMAEERKKLTIADLKAKRDAGERLVMVSVPDFPMAIWAERAGIDLIGVGDSLAMISYGHPNTLPTTVDQMIEHSRAVRRGAPNTFSFVSMPYGSYATPELGVLNAIRLMKEGETDGVKMQGGREKAHIIKAIADAGVPVMSHVGLCPHFVHQYGGFKLQGRTAEAALKIIDDAVAIEEAGAIGIEIEAVPRPVAEAVNDAVGIFTFSIGAGASSCGQLLLGADLLGSFDQFKPKFAKRYAQISEIAVKAFEEFAEEVRSKSFPDDDHSYGMKAEEEEKLRAALKKARG